MATPPSLEQALLDLRALLARPDNDFSWSSWLDQGAALAEIDRHLAELRTGTVPELGVLLAPAGPAQEVSLGSGWARDYLHVADTIERELARARGASKKPGP